MTTIQDTIYPSDLYNKLPQIRHVFGVPHQHCEDIKDLKHLLLKHNTSPRVGIKLIHTHFRLEDGEVFSFKDVHIPRIGAVTIMAPRKATSGTQLYGSHYLVNDKGNFEAYEYMESPGPDMSECGDFLSEFADLLTSRGLERKLGLSLKPDAEDVGFTEFEIPSQRTCINIPPGIDLPAITDNGFDTDTEWCRDVDPSSLQLGSPKPELTPAPGRRAEGESFDKVACDDGLPPLTLTRTYRRHNNKPPPPPPSPPSEQHGEGQQLTHTYRAHNNKPPPPKQHGEGEHRDGDTASDAGLSDGDTISEPDLAEDSGIEGFYLHEQGDLFLANNKIDRESDLHSVVITVIGELPPN